MVDTHPTVLLAQGHKQHPVKAVPIPRCERIAWPVWFATSFQGGSTLRSPTVGL